MDDLTREITATCELCHRNFPVTEMEEVVEDGYTGVVCHGCARDFRREDS